ncbi:MAG: MFS transporter [Candidatus Kapabacteria bacterium]|nr:MFS transporter [Candidatus Kapabacteria bacterium]
MNSTSAVTGYSSRERLGWYFYDWANSSYPLVINTAIFPLYYAAVTTTNGDKNVTLFGACFLNSALYSYAIALSFVLVSLITPLLSGIADYSGKKKLFLRIFCTIGSIACASLFFFTGNALATGLLSVMLASIGFSGSLVFYNAFLPEIAPPDEQDAVSARGFSMGYAGSSLLLIFCLSLILKPTLYGITTEGRTDTELFVLIAPWTFLLVALWWQGFAQITFRRLREREGRVIEGNIVTAGFRELRTVWVALQSQRTLKLYLAAFFCISMGVQTVILMSTFFGEQEIHMASGELIGVLLLLQFVAIGGSYFFSWLSKRIGNIPALMAAVVLWICICISARFITSSAEFYILSALVGIVLGGTQSLARSTYSKLLDGIRDTASYFSFYDICEKTGIIVGMFSYGGITDLTGSMRNAIVALVVFFLIGLLLLIRLLPSMRAKA